MTKIENNSQEFKTNIYLWKDYQAFHKTENRIGDILTVFTVQQRFFSIHSKLYMISSSVD